MAPERAKLLKSKFVLTRYNSKGKGIMNTLKLSKLSQSLALAALLGVGAAVLAPKAHAANPATANLTVQATVNANCTISTTTLDFGSYDPVVANAATALNGTGKVSAPVIALDFGLNASGILRQMKITGGGSDLLSYQLYKPSSNAASAACSFPGTTVWADGTGGTSTLTPTSPPNKNSRDYNVCGTISAGQDVSVGSYQDTVVASVSF